MRMSDEKHFMNAEVSNLDHPLISMTIMKYPWTKWTMLIKLLFTLLMSDRKKFESDAAQTFPYFTLRIMFVKNGRQWKTRLAAFETQYLYIYWLHNISVWSANLHNLCWYSLSTFLGWSSLQRCDCRRQPFIEVHLVHNLEIPSRPPQFEYKEMCWLIGWLNSRHELHKKPKLKCVM